MSGPAPILRGSKPHDLFALTAECPVYDDAVEMALMSYAKHMPKHEHWAITWSDGRVSTATRTLFVHLIEAGRLAPPKALTVQYADNRQELAPLAIAAFDVMKRLARYPWIRLRGGTAPLDRQFLVYILGQAFRRRTTTHSAGAPGRSRSTRWRPRSRQTSPACPKPTWC